MSLLIKSFVFVSNFLNHHQLPFCLEMVKLFNGGFYFIATEPIHEERLVMGYVDMNNLYPFVLKSYESSCAYNEAKNLCYNSDVVMIGSAPDDFIKKRIKEDKLTFKYTERIFKKGRWRILDPRVTLNLLLRHTQYFNKRVYLLSASAYAAGDFSMVGAYQRKCYKWGYFPKVTYASHEEIMAKKNNSKLAILWAGRFKKWKHPEKALIAAKYLFDNGINFRMTFIGGGEMEDYIKLLTTKYKLDTYVDFTGYQTPEVVRESMKKSDIFLFTSDYQEGWGAVLNEAMNSGCAVVCSNAIGSVPYLIKDNVNGMVYKNNDINDLKNKVLLLARDSEIRKKISINAYEAICDLWSPCVAAKRLLELSEALIYDDKVFRQYIDGPCAFIGKKM